MHQLSTQLSFRPALETGSRIPLLQLLEAQDLPTADIQASTQLYALREDKQLVGVGGLEYYDAFALLRSVCVQDARRGKGYGRLMVEQLEQIARAQDCKAIYLLTTTAADFFNGLNYTMIDRQQVPAVLQQASEFASVCPASATVMWKKL